MRARTGVGFVAASCMLAAAFYIAYVVRLFFLLFVECVEKHLSRFSNHQP
jgi:hypothetical protein